MRCWNCGAENLDASRFCSTCAAPQSQDAFRSSERAHEKYQNDEREWFLVWLIFVGFWISSSALGVVFIVLGLTEGMADLLLVGVSFAAISALLTVAVVKKSIDPLPEKRP
jgi:hypothetical protein